MWSLSAGVDSMFTDKLELSVMSTWSSYSGNNNAILQGENVGGQIAGRYHWTPNISTAVIYTIDNSDTFGIDLRYAFAL